LGVCASKFLAHQLARRLFQIAGKRCVDANEIVPKLGLVGTASKELAAGSRDFHGRRVETREQVLDDCVQGDQRRNLMRLDVAKPLPDRLRQRQEAGQFAIDQLSFGFNRV
jgi:hypothetical protein